MLAQAKKLILTSLTVLLFSFIVLFYQNCAKPLDEIGMNSSLSSSGACNISASPKTAYINEGPLTLTYSFLNDISYKIRVIVVQNSTGAFTENLYTQGGTLSASYTAAEQAGQYTAHGVVEDAGGATVGRCQDTFSVITRAVVPPPPPQATYSWSPGAWGACSVSTCGQTGTQLRGVSCLRNDNVVVAESYCSSAGTKPSTSQGCSTPACTATYTYSWEIGAWGACSVTACGLTGTQSRSVICKRDDGVTASDANCGSKPDVTQSCSTPRCGGGGGGGGGSCKIGDVFCP